MENRNQSSVSFSKIYFIFDTRDKLLHIFYIFAYITPRLFLGCDDQYIVFLREDDRR